MYIEYYTLRINFSKRGTIDLIFRLFQRFVYRYLKVSRRNEQSVIKLPILDNK